MPRAPPAPHLASKQAALHGRRQRAGTVGLARVKGGGRIGKPCCASTPACSRHNSRSAQRCDIINNTAPRTLRLVFVHRHHEHLAPWRQQRRHQWQQPVDHAPPPLAACDGDTGEGWCVCLGGGGSSWQVVPACRGVWQGTPPHRAPQGMLPSLRCSALAASRHGLAWRASALGFSRVKATAGCLLLHHTRRLPLLHFLSGTAAAPRGHMHTHLPRQLLSPLAPPLLRGWAHKGG